MLPRLRFHLAPGEHFRHWQVRSGSSVEYFDPSKCSLTIRGCRLVVQPGTASRVYRSGVKAVCGWVEFESIEVGPPAAPGRRLLFNPIDDVHWRLDGEVVDGHRFDVLWTSGREVSTR